ncbi:testis, prostate and placenta-expressed protein [Plakobranchus ocellatus]|uniref:Testis, prostate and placenta-expressed protein n=1 Tax=Plakobranchus ocellatus TaxID=259542 RepID=A0AAV4A7K0_9GAST|nr:testis, prostate and placenta-expressed protein [Plakobranchus ocellatus]
MTTVGVDAARPARVDALRVPSYAYHYPSLKRVQLAAVKHGMFHPDVPRLRRMDMDNAIHKLSDEHCRNTTTCGPPLKLTFTSEQRAFHGLCVDYNGCDQMPCNVLVTAWDL